MSRVEAKTFSGKPMLLMATSPGARGGVSVLEVAKNRFRYHDANIVDVFSFPSLGANFFDGIIINEELNSDLITKVKAFQKAL